MDKYLNELVTVIIPIYNNEKYLERCIQSTVNQTYKNLEILLIDDGSTDFSPVICDQWHMKDDRIRVFHQKNQGISVARNKGLENAHGQYICMLDSDDYISKDAILKMYRGLIDNSLDLIIGSFVKGNEDSYIFPELFGKIELIDGIEAVRRSYLSSDNALKFIVPWGKLYSRKCFEHIKYPEGKIFEDIYVTHEILLECNTIGVFSDPIVYYYQHPESIMNREFHIKKLDYLQALKNRVLCFSDYGLQELTQIAYDEYLHSLVWEYSRVRDILHDKMTSKTISNAFREFYKWGYASVRYPNENQVFLGLFYLNPEIIIWYWRIKAKFAVNEKHRTDSVIIERSK